jgi:nitrite reductase (NADH) small subunit/3-phenylpropionate/trans-cinnamate dioxygenase ferredoxin subunit
MPGITGLLRLLLLGRRHGTRARLRRRFGLGWMDEATGPRDAEPRPTTPAPGVVAGGRAAREAPKGVTPPDGFEVALHKDALAPGEITEVIVAGRAVAVCNVQGTFYAVSSTCAHAGGPIGDGKLEGHTVTCPYHGWSYDVRDGTCFVNAEVRLPTYEVRVVGDAVCVGA